MNKIQYSNLRIYNVLNEELNVILINRIIQNEPCHLVSLFKEFLIYDEWAEFFKRFYTKEESALRLKKLNEYYYESSMLFPNYTSLPEGKYIYKNIMKKQNVIDLMEAMDDEKEKEIKKKKILKEKETQRVFDTKIYESIAFDIDNSKIKEMFSLKDDIPKEQDSIDSIDKLATYISDVVESNTTITISKKNTNTNLTVNTTTTNTVSITNNHRTNSIFISPPTIRVKFKGNQGMMKHQSIKLSINPNLKIKLNPTIKTKKIPKINLNKVFSTSPTVTMPSIDSQRREKKLNHKKMNTNNNLVINHNFLQSLPNEQYSRSRERKRINSNVLTEIFNNSNNRSNSNNNNKYSTINTGTIYQTTKGKFEFKVKSPRNIIHNEKKNDFMKRNAKFPIFSTFNECVTERKIRGRKCLKLLS